MMAGAGNRGRDTPQLRAEIAASHFRAVEPSELHEGCGASGGVQPRVDLTGSGPHGFGQAAGIYVVAQREIAPRVRRRHRLAQQDARRGQTVLEGASPDQANEARVVILQPQLTRTEHDACNDRTAGATRILKMKQLHTLMLGARLSAGAVGASLEGWGAA